MLGFNQIRSSQAFLIGREIERSAATYAPQYAPRYREGTSPKHDIGKSGEQSYIAMEFLDGVTLKHWVAGKSSDIETVLSLGIEIADADALAAREQAWSILFRIDLRRTCAKLCHCNGGELEQFCLFLAKYAA